MPGPYMGRYTYPLVDVTVTRVAPGATHRTATTGSISEPSGDSEITLLGSVRAQSSTALSGLFGDLTRLRMRPPIVQDSGGNIVYPDCYVWPIVDGVALDHVMRIDASAPRNMLPNPMQTVGQIEVLIGIPFREAVRAGMENLPLKATGLKAAISYRFGVYSERGWGITGDTVLRPLRIIGLGDLLTADEVADVARRGYNGSFSNQAPGQPEFRGVHRLKGGPLSEKTWASLPGGTNQAETKIWRFFRQAINRQASPASNRMYLTRNTELGGAETFVDDGEDLGFDFTRGAFADDYLRITHAGVIRGTNQAFWGVRINDQIVPAGVGGTSEGLPVSDDHNPWQYGAVQPQRADSGLYYALPKTPFDIAVFQNKVVFFVAPNGTAIPADEASIAVAGIYVQVGEQ